MKNGNMWVAFSGALLVSCILSGCTMPRSLSAWMGDERTLPDNAQVDFSKPHRPILNPLNDPGQGPQTEGDLIPQQEEPVRKPVRSSRNTSGRKVPSENLAILSGHENRRPMVQAAPVVPVVSEAEPVSKPVFSAVEAAPAPAHKMASEKPAAPVEKSASTKLPFSTGELPQEKAAVAPAPAPEKPKLAAKPAIPPVAEAEDIAESKPVVEAAPTKVLPWGETAPAAAAAKPAEKIAEPGVKLMPPSARKAATNAVTVAPKAEAPKAEAKAAPVAVKASEEAAAEPVDSSTPSLSSVPAAPAHTPLNQAKKEVQDLSAKRETTQAAGKALLEDKKSTVMTSPETGKLVDNAAKAKPAAEVKTADDKSKKVDTFVKTLAEEDDGDDNSSDDLTIPPAAKTKSAASLTLTPPAAGKNEAAPAAAPAAAAKENNDVTGQLQLIAPSAAKAKPTLIPASETTKGQGSSGSASDSF